MTSEEKDKIIKAWGIFHVDTKRNFTLTEVQQINRYYVELVELMDSVFPYRERQDKGYELDAKCKCEGDEKRKQLEWRALQAKLNTELFRIKRLDRQGKQEYAVDPNRSMIEERIQSNQLETQ